MVSGTCLQPSVQLSEAERHAVHALGQWLRNHSTAPGDQDDLPESDEDGELAEAFTSSSRHSGAVRIRQGGTVQQQQQPRLTQHHSQWRASLELAMPGPCCMPVADAVSSSMHRFDHTHQHQTSCKLKLAEAADVLTLCTSRTCVLQHQRERLLRDVGKVSAPCSGRLTLCGLAGVQFMQCHARDHAQRAVPLS